MSGPLKPPRPLRRGVASEGALLAAIRDHSPYLAGLIDEEPERAQSLLAQGPDGELADVVSALAEACYADEAQAMKALRRAKRRMALAVALADLSGRFNVEEATEALTQFADAATGAALRFALAEAARSGRLRVDPDAPEQAGLVVLALGKHGGRELNYSSDIDLSIFYDPAAAAVPEGAAPGPIYVRVAQRLARLLEQRTGDGYALRVDLRLRPDPGATPVAMALSSALSYYETLGQNWERAAMIKARPVAGDLALGRAFLAELSPFVWRKYFDYAAIADIHAMKRQIHAVRGHEQVAVAGHDVKLGRGGIREIEFFVQTQQLIFGGRRPRLRGARTLEMLRELGREGWVSAEAVDELSRAYVFLRAVEHRLQMIADEQTQRLPVDERALARFARFCGYPGAAGFARDLSRHLRAVEKHYARLFEDAPGLADAAGSLVFTGVADDPDTLETLRRLGFHRPAEATETIRGWHFGRRPALRSARAREVLTELTPALIAAFSGSGDADSALAAFDAALARMPAAVELMSILRSNGALRELFGDLLGGAPRLAEAVAGRPHLLDAVIDPGRGAAPADWMDEAAAARRAEAFLAPARDFEDALNRARDYAAEDKFLIGVRLLSGALDADMAARAHSALAQALIAALLSRIEAEFAAEHGAVSGGRVAVLAMGKLGSREMTAASDLDLIVIYDGAEAPSDGRRPLPPSLYYARLTQRLVAALTAPTKAGRLYEVDLRLRPSGRQGPLATSLPAFARYQREEAETWERMALTRARVVAGSSALAREIEAIVRETVRRPPPPRLAREILDMRALIAREKRPGGAFDLKLAPGGLIDVEFAAQYLILAHACDVAALAGPETREALAAAGRAGVIAAADAETLAKAHRLLTAVTQVLRLTLSDEADPRAAATGVKRRLAAAAGAPDFARLEAELAESRAAARAAFLRVVRDDKPPGPG